MPKITDQQEKFCTEYYSNGFNTAEAMRSAGYKGKRIAEMAYKLRNKPQVAKRLEELADQQMKRYRAEMQAREEAKVYKFKKWKL